MRKRPRSIFTYELSDAQTTNSGNRILHGRIRNSECKTRDTNFRISDLWIIRIGVPSLTLTHTHTSARVVPTHVSLSRRVYNNIVLIIRFGGGGGGSCVGVSGLTRNKRVTLLFGRHPTTTTTRCTSIEYSIRISVWGRAHSRAGTRGPSAIVPASEPGRSEHNITAQRR